MAFLGRKCTALEWELAPVERLVWVVWWAMHRLQRYTAFAQTTVMLPDADVVAMIKMRAVHQSLTGYLVDLAMYRITWREGPSFHSYCMDWINMSALLDPLLVACDKKTGEPLRPPCVEHADVALRCPEHKAASGSLEGRSCAFFDGGA